MSWIKTRDIRDGQITAAKLAADAVVTAGIADEAVTAAKLATTATAPTVVTDPGTGVAIPVDKSAIIPIATAAAETNTLADPTFPGQVLILFCDTYAVGARVITAASRINQAANTVITLGAVGDYIKLEAITIGGALKWQVVANDGAALV